MSLPVPNLDDRSWKQIVDEAVRLIPRYAPEWTNHNASDPGITLLELYAWMTEMVIYRLNKVPEKNFLTFLDLIGVRLKPPEPARVVLEFTPSEGVEGELVVKRGTQVATLQAGGQDPVTFETLRDITLLPVSITRAVRGRTGVRLKAPEPGGGVLECAARGGVEGGLVVKRGTQVATLQPAGQAPVTFETLRDITLLPVSITRAVSSHREKV